MFHTETDCTQVEGDLLAAEEVSDLVADLATAAKHVYGEIEELERLAPLVSCPERRQEARSRIVELRWRLCEFISAATHGHYTPVEVKEWIEHVLRKGAAFPLLNVSVIRDLAYIRRVPNAGLRKAVLDHLEEDEGGYRALVDNARDRLVALERTHGEDYGSAAWRIASEEQASRTVLEFRRHLGMETKVNGRGVVNCSFLVPYEKAVAISQAIGMHPLQAGV